MPSPIWSIPLELTNFNIITSVLGGFVSLFGLVSYLLKEHYYLSEARKMKSSRMKLGKRTCADGIKLSPSSSALASDLRVPTSSAQGTTPSAATRACPMPSARSTLIP